MASILSVRAELLAGDLRALYLLWLLSVQVGEVSDDAVEPPVPASLNALTGSQTALVEFLRIDRDLIDVAAAGSAPMRGARVDVARWVAGLSGAERDALLVGLLEGDDPCCVRRRCAGRDRVSVPGRHPGHRRSLSGRDTATPSTWPAHRFDVIWTFTSAGDGRVLPRSPNVYWPKTRRTSSRVDPFKGRLSRRCRRGALALRQLRGRRG